MAFTGHCAGQQEWGPDPGVGRSRGLCTQVIRLSSGFLMRLSWGKEFYIWKTNLKISSSSLPLLESHLLLVKTWTAQKPIGKKKVKITIILQSRENFPWHFYIFPFALCSIPIFVSVSAWNTWYLPFDSLLLFSHWHSFPSLKILPKQLSTFNE